MIKSTKWVSSDWYIKLNLTEGLTWLMKQWKNAFFWVLKHTGVHDGIRVKWVKFLIKHKKTRTNTYTFSLVVCCDKEDLYTSDITHRYLKINGNGVYDASHRDGKKD